MLGKLINWLSGVGMVSGFVLMIGTFGSADLNLINFSTLAIRSVVAVLLILGGFVGFKFGAPIYIDWD
jgi:hypothetical protein